MFKHKPIVLCGRLTALKMRRPNFKRLRALVKHLLMYAAISRDHCSTMDIIQKLRMSYNFLKPAETGLPVKIWLSMSWDSGNSIDYETSRYTEQSERNKLHFLDSLFESNISSCLRGKCENRDKIFALRI